MKLVVTSVAMVAGLALASPARAQPGMSAPQLHVDTVDEGVALGLSLGGTALSWALLIAGGENENGPLTTIGVAGTMFAPSFGHWYAHDGFTRGLGMRVIGATAIVVGLGIAFDDIFDEDSNDDDTAVGLLMLGGLGLYVAGTVDDIATVGGAARKYNARFEDVSLLPTANAHGGGFALIGRF